MFKRNGVPALAAAVTLALGCFVATPAVAAVYCKSVGIPKGCVARPVPKTVVAAPVAKAAVVTTPAVGVAGGVGGPASGVGVLPGAGAGAAGTAGPGVANQNGGVNRAGRR